MEEHVLKLYSTRSVRRVLALALITGAVFTVGYATAQGEGGVAKRAVVSAGAAAQAMATSAGATADATAGGRLDASSVQAMATTGVSRYVGRVVTRAPFPTKKVALTFDDGPSEQTEKLLAILRKHDAKATFFFVGTRMVGQEYAILDVIQQGSEVGNHTWAHSKLQRMSTKAMEAQIRLAQDEIYRTTGVRNVLVRPKAGMYDKAALDVVRKMGLVMVGWDTAGHDTFADRKTAKQIESVTLSDVHGGSIVLFHDVTPTTVQALPGILEGLKRKGYTCVTVSELLASQK